MGTAHAILCARDILQGNTIVAYADTLFRADFELDTSREGIIWIQKVEDPGAFGVIELNGSQEIVGFVEKPDQFVSDLAIIGIYFAKNGLLLKQAIQYLVDNDLKDNGEYQLTNALENMKERGVKFVPEEVSEWLDCGNKDATVLTNRKYLDFIMARESEGLISPSVRKDNSVIIPPVYLGNNVELHNSVLGPYVSIGENTIIKDSRIQNSIIQNDSSVINANIANSMIGNSVNFQSTSKDLSIGDFCTVID